jgi:hypothetical protein
MSFGSKSSKIPAVYGQFCKDHRDLTGKGSFSTYDLVSQRNLGDLLIILSWFACDLHLADDSALVKVPLFSNSL